MSKPRLLIAGDSFAADWTVAYPDRCGWVNLITADFEVTNIAQAGSSEYRIWKTLATVDVGNFDRILISHTSPYRLYVKHHPVHSKSALHKDCDLLYTDAVAHGLATVKDYFENYYDLNYAVDIHQLIMSKIYDSTITATHISHVDVSAPANVPITNFSDVWTKHKGIMNHYSDQGNQIIYSSILNLLKG